MQICFGANFRLHLRREAFSCSAFSTMAGRDKEVNGENRVPRVLIFAVSFSEMDPATL
uniref:Uncharacterized protein n=1 Tax=Physcomitrium patens TaxID=3218 RepID=A0A7I4E872_PHYPA